MEDPIAWLSLLKQWLDENAWLSLPLAFGLITGGVLFSFAVAKWRSGSSRKDGFWSFPAPQLMFLPAIFLLVVQALPQALIQSWRQATHSYLTRTVLARNLPLRWMSDTGTVELVTFQADRLHVETLSQEVSAEDAFKSAELRKSPSALYAGVAHGTVGCPPSQDRKCGREREIEITSMTQNRIEGWIRIYGTTKSSGAWRRFAWRPEHRLRNERS